jgi:hypothetical protein
VSAAAHRIADLLAGMAPASALAPVADIAVGGLALDSRRVRAGDAFVALAGTTAHGITFAPQAVERGAVVVLAESRESEIGNGESKGQGRRAAPLSRFPIPESRPSGSTICRITSAKSPRAFSITRPRRCR